MKRLNSPKKGPHNTAHRNPFKAILNRFTIECNQYKDCFTVANRSVFQQAKDYLFGLCAKSSRKNMERMDEYLPSSSYESLQSFISDSPWDYKAFNKRISEDVNNQLGPGTKALIIDESCFAKKGNKSVGVARQWNGRLGKIENSQVGVFAALSNGSLTSLIDYRLYLPQEWINDPARCEKAKIPKQYRVFKSKTELAIELIESALENGIDFDCVLADGFYSIDPRLTQYIESLGIEFIIDYHKRMHVYREDPAPYLPRRKKGSRGPKYKTYQSRIESESIESVLNSIEESRWQKVRVRSGTKGFICVNACKEIVWLWDKESNQRKQYHLIFTKDLEGSKVKYFVSNASAKVTLHFLVRRHAWRYWIERSFQDAKTSLGMADYQMRGWYGWHHHMSMVMLAMKFVNNEKIINNEEFELLSFQDVVELFDHYLERKDRNEDELLQNMMKRHKKRKQLIESAYS